MSAFLRSFGVFSQVLMNRGSCLPLFVISTATDIGPSQFSARSTSLRSLSIDMTVKSVISVLF